jgi:hypothetical protein
MNSTNISNEELNSLSIDSNLEKDSEDSLDSDEAFEDIEDM